jgi:hypothetical protein
MVAVALVQACLLACSADEADPIDLLGKAILDSDEVRILYNISGREANLTGYRSMTLKGKKWLADVFSKAEIRRLGNPDGTEDPTGGDGFNTDRGMILNVYKNKRLTHQMLIIAGDYINLVLPKYAWYETSFANTPKADSPVDINAPSIEDILLRDVKILSASGDWEEALSWTGDLDELNARTEGFLPGIVKPSATKPAAGKEGPK